VFSTILLQLIILFLPTQLGLHFWPEFSRAAGIKVDYLSPTLYFIDILIASFVLLNLQSVVGWLKHNLTPVLIFLVFALLNTYFSVSPLNSLSWWTHLTLYIIFFLVLRLRMVSWANIRASLLASTFLIIILEIVQFVNQS